VAQGETITLTVHSGFVELRKVPDVVGLSAAEAKRRMSAMGLSALMKAGGAPTSRERAGTVERQNPDPGAAVASGSEVSLFIQGPFVETIAVPDVVGISYPDSKRKLDSAGLTIDRRDAGKPAERRFAETVQKQEPAAGTRVSKGSAVSVWVYSQYIPTREELVAATDCSLFPGSRAYWDNSAGKPLCGCFNGLQWNLTNTQCVTANVRENELCAREGQGLMPQGRTAQGKINCVCPEGLTWNPAQRACEKLIPPEELCSRNYPGSVPTGRDDAGRVNCDCPQGYAWNAARTACQKLPQSQELSPQEYCSRNFPGSVPDGNDATGRVLCVCPQEYVWSADKMRCVAGTTIQTTEGPCDLVGVWQSRDGDFPTVQFTRSGNEYSGVAVKVSSLLQGWGYRQGEVIYKVRKTGQGQYEGSYLNRNQTRREVKWDRVHIVEDDSDPMMLKCHQMRFNFYVEWLSSPSKRRFNRLR
jgi:hypothetical protein